MFINGIKSKILEENFLIFIFFTTTLHGFSHVHVMRTHGLPGCGTICHHLCYLKSCQQKWTSYLWNHLEFQGS